MVNFTTIDSTGRSTPNTSKRVARRNVLPSTEANPRNIHITERRGQIDRRMMKGEKRVMDRRNFSNRRRSTINLSI